MAIKSNGIAVTVGGVAVTGVTDVNISGVDVNNIDTTDHASTARTFVGGLVDYGTCEISGKFSITGQAPLIGDEGDTETFVVTYSNGATATFSAIIGGFNVSNPLDDTIDFSCSSKITGAIALAAAAE